MKPNDPKHDVVYKLIDLVEAHYNVASKNNEYSEELKAKAEEMFPGVTKRDVAKALYAGSRNANGRLHYVDSHDGRVIIERVLLVDKLRELAAPPAPAIHAYQVIIRGMSLDAINANIVLYKEALHAELPKVCAK